MKFLGLYMLFLQVLSGCADQSDLVPIAPGDWSAYMVFFKDKRQNAHTLGNPSTYLSDRALRRREKHNFATTQEDLPVTQQYLDELAEIQEVSVTFSTRWLNGVLVRCSKQALKEVKVLHFVQRVVLVAPPEFIPLDGEEPVAGMPCRADDHIVNDIERATLAILDMHRDDLYGEGVLIAITDTGFPHIEGEIPFLHLQDHIVDTYDFVTHGWIYDPVHGMHGTRVLGVLAGYTERRVCAYVAPAYRAHYALYLTEDIQSEYRIEEYNWLFAAERADSLGADIMQVSLGYKGFDVDSMSYPNTMLDGKQAVITRAANMAHARGLLIIAAIGNDGELGMVAPADSPHVLSVGGITRQLPVNNYVEKVDFSAVGPTADGRIKPDVVAIAHDVRLLLQDHIQSISGTSFATPQISGLAAGLLQKFPSKTNVEIADLIRKSGHQADNPDNRLGYGLPTYKRAVEIEGNSAQ